MEETRAEAAAKAAAAEKLLSASAKAEDGGDGAPMETDEADRTAASSAGEDPTAVGMDVDGAAADGDAAAATDEKEPAELVKELTAFEDPELPENKTGWYELVAILTHKGQNADGGHYVAWVQHKDDTWVCFDDDKVTECRYASQLHPAAIMSTTRGCRWRDVSPTCCASFAPGNNTAGRCPRSDSCCCAMCHHLAACSSAAVRNCRASSTAALRTTTCRT